jgi:L-asparaginase
MALPAVAVYSLGGTISATHMGGSGVEPSLSGEALVEDVPEIAKRGRGFSRIFRQLPGSKLALDGLVELSGEIKGRVDEGSRGVVVSQGTDTIEETAFVLDLLVDTDAPVVVTRAMRNPTLPGTRARPTS